MGDVLHVGGRVLREPWPNTRRLPLADQCEFLELEMAALCDSRANAVQEVALEVVDLVPLAPHRDEVAIQRNRARTHHQFSSDGHATEHLPLGPVHGLPPTR